MSWSGRHFEDSCRNETRIGMKPFSVGSPKKRKRGDSVQTTVEETSAVESSLDSRKGINCLPQELLANIFSYLPPEGIPECSLVCRKWREATHVEDNLWRKLAFTRWPCYVNSKRNQSWRSFFISNYRCERLSERFPFLSDEIELDVASLSLDKVFSCGWLPLCHSQNETQRYILAGTKNHKLLVIDSSQLRMNVFSPPSISVTPITLSDRSVSYPCHGGIRVVLFHPLNGTVVTSGCSSHQMLLWDAKSFLSSTKCPKPLAGFSEHSDWIFAADWLNDSVFATAGRDGKVYAWNTEPNESVVDNILLERNPSYEREEVPIFKSISKLVDHGSERRIREIKSDPFHKQFGILSLSNEEDGEFQVWDVEQRKSISTVPLSSSRDAVTLAYYPERNVYFVGSHVRLYMVDPRAGRIQKALYFISNLHASHIRSLIVRYHMLTIGFGTGRLFFYDLRRGWVRQENQTDSPGPHLIEDYNPAVYCMSYTEDGQNLFIGGGPLQLNLYGSYASFLKVNPARLVQTQRPCLEA
ncbi:DDB1- and CUL4-associated factor 12 [Galdieria sulphuraria]|nr:DDB1- and CUL4-associated factor 12 [Galdieria sulphuraria]